MHQAQDIFSLTDFKQNAKKHLERMHTTGRPEILTVNGRAQAVLLTPETYDRLLDAASQDAKGRVALGLAQARAGKLMDGTEALTARRARRTADRRGRH